jgi:hypothetical protein
MKYIINILCVKMCSSSTFPNTYLILRSYYQNISLQHKMLITCAHCVYPLLLFFVVFAHCEVTLEMGCVRIGYSFFVNVNKI